MYVQSEGKGMHVSTLADALVRVFERNDGSGEVALLSCVLIKLFKKWRRMNTKN